MNTEPLIIWEKWHDPILNNLLDTQEAFNQQIIEEDEDTNLYDGDAYKENDNRGIINKYPIIITPMGVLPYVEKTSCDKTFNFWMGHTNFTITKNISSIIEQIDGIETLDIFTRYRFRIGIGKAFKDSTVMTNINSIVYENIYE